MVTPRPCGTNVIIMRTMVPPSTPFAIRSSATSMMGGNIRRNVRTSKLSPNGGTTSRMMYRSVIRSIGLCRRDATVILSVATGCGNDAKEP